jgi:L-lactate dehydrogenase complex protein LldG
MLARIRQAIGQERPAPEGEYAAIARGYRAVGELDAAARAGLFASRLRDYGAGVHGCPGSALAPTIAGALEERGIRSVVTAPDVPAEWLPHGIDVVRDSGLDYRQLDGSQGVLTGCTVAIALTGTIVLCHTGIEGRRALTLVPDYHLCVVRAPQIVETVPEAIGRVGLLSPALITTISGPSATADIEMTRVSGVHGPRTLDVVIVD